MSTFLTILLASTLLSLGSLSGVLALIWQKDKLNHLLHLLVALSTGTLMGGAFLHLLPEALELFGDDILMPFALTLASFILFYVIEKVLHWRHCHTEDCQVHSFGYLNLIGDAVHNFIDGLIIAASFVTSRELGIAATMAIAVHEIPQEIGDLGVLLHAGFSRRKALVYNLLVSGTSIIGAIMGYFLAVYVSVIIPYLLPLAAGGFVYIAASDLIPELRKEEDLRRSMGALGVFLIGVLIMYLLHFVGHE